MPYYKRVEDELIRADSVVGPDFTLEANTPGNNSYPVDGWFWFANLDEALSHFAPVSGSITPRQCRLALLQVGLLDTVNAAIDAAGTEARIEWDYATVVRRDSPLLAAMTTSLGMTTQQIDDLFTLAKTL